MSDEPSPTVKRMAVNAIHRNLVEVGLDLLMLYHFNTLKFDCTKDGEPRGTLELSVDQKVDETISVTVSYYEAKINPQLGTGVWRALIHSGEIFGELEKVLSNAKYKTKDNRTYTRS